MIKNIIFILCSLISIPLFAQNDWGYCLTEVRYTTPTDSVVADTLFISEVINLAKLNCNVKDKNTRKNRIYAACICDWFYKKIEEDHTSALSFVSKDDLIGEIELYSDFPGSRQYMKISEEEKQSIFMNKKIANKKRDTFLDLAQHNKAIVVKIK